MHPQHHDIIMKVKDAVDSGEVASKIEAMKMRDGLIESYG